jgi:hypothetical protein
MAGVRMKPWIKWNGYRWVCVARSQEVRRIYIGFGTSPVNAYWDMWRKI